MFLANLLLNAVTGVEMYLLGKINVESLAAYSIVVTSFMALYASVHGGLINAAIAFVSRRCGAGEQGKVSEALPSMLLFGMGVFVCFGLIAYASLTPVLNFFGAKGDVLAMSKDYLSIMLLTCIFMSFYSVLLGVARGAGDSLTPLKIIGVIAVINIVLDVLFIGYFNMGIKGAAYAGVATYMTGAALYVRVFLKGLGGIKLSKASFKPGLVKTYAVLTWKSLGQNFTADTGNILMLKIVSGYGNPFIAAYGVVGRLINFLMMAGWPICNSGGVVVGQNLGKKKMGRAMASVVESFKIYLWVVLPTTVAFYFFSGPIISVFTADAAVAAYGATYLKIVSLCLPLMAAGLAAQGAFNGAGSIGMPTVLNVLSYIIVRVGLALYLPGFQAIREAGVFWAFSLSFVFFGIINWVFYRRGKWTRKEI